MARTDEEILEKYRTRLKKQNDKIKEDYDRVSATLPRGTIKRIRTLGLSINGAINSSVLAYLDKVEQERGITIAENDNSAVTETENALESPETHPVQEEPEPDPPCEENNFDGLLATEWSRELHKGKIPYQPQWGADSTYWSAKDQEWYDRPPFE